MSSLSLEIKSQDHVLAAQVRNVLANGGTWTDVVSLTAASGAASDTVADVTAAFDQTTLNNNFRSLAAKINELIVLVNNVNA
jgi:hypothetical protein